MSAAFERQDNFSFAQAELAKAYEASNKDAGVVQQFARFLLRRKNVNRAEEVLEESLSVNPGHVENIRLFLTSFAEISFKGLSFFPFFLPFGFYFLRIVLAHFEGAKVTY